ncbi:MAG TPA: hypothetical protein DCY79_24435 [Planctomycetaceae bacterium]|nr:hypothetical protein [Planctomycetaceae bacterium]
MLDNFDFRSGRNTSIPANSLKYSSMPIIVPSRLLICALTLPLVLGVRSGLTAADSPRKHVVSPRVFGLDAEIRSVTPGRGERVVTAGTDGSSTVGLVHVDLGGDKIVMLPDGRLVARSAADCKPTERPFEAADKERLAADLLRDLPGFKTQETRRYLYVYNTSEEFALATSRILETMFPGVVAHAESQRIEVSKPQVPLVAIMFRNERDFQNYRRMPEGIVAYYEPVSNRIVMYEKSTAGAVKPELAIQQSLSTIAHEGAHQILHNIGVQKRLSVWPMWLSEGLAEYYAPTSTGKRLRWKGAGQVNDMRMYELEQYIKSRTADSPDGDMVRQTVIAGRLTSTGYAAAWSLTHYLAKSRRVEFNNYVREVSQLGPLETFGTNVGRGTNPENLALFQQTFGDELAEIEKRLVLHLKRQPYDDPFAEWPHFVAMLVYNNGRRQMRDANVFHTSELAAQWTRETVKKLPEEQQRTVQQSIRPMANRPVAVRFVQQWLRGN